MKYRLGNLEKKNARNNVVSGSSGSGDPVLWELRGERGLKQCQHSDRFEANRGNLLPMGITGVQSVVNGC